MKSVVVFPPLDLAEKLRVGVAKKTTAVAAATGTHDEVTNVTRFTIPLNKVIT